MYTIDKIMTHIYYAYMLSKGPSAMLTISYFYIVIFLHFQFFECWVCTLSRGQIDGSLFVHQRLWVFLMVSIDQNDMSFKHNPKINK